ncbi:30S ribosomal protein S20 [Chloroflexota bacterium]
MPNTKSAKKQVRVIARRSVRNRAARSEVKTHITGAEKLIFAGNLPAAATAVKTAVSSLDKAAEKGILHPKNVARRKARLLKKINQAQSPVIAETEPEASE